MFRLRVKILAVAKRYCAGPRRLPSLLGRSETETGSCGSLSVSSRRHQVRIVAPGPNRHEPRTNPSMRQRAPAAW